MDRNDVAAMLERGRACRSGWRQLHLPLEGGTDGALDRARQEHPGARLVVLAKGRTTVGDRIGASVGRPEAVLSSQVGPAGWRGPRGDPREGPKARRWAHQRPSRRSRWSGAVLDRLSAQPKFQSPSTLARSPAKAAKMAVGAIPKGCENPTAVVLPLGGVQPRRSLCVRP